MTLPLLVANSTSHWLVVAVSVALTSYHLQLEGTTTVVQNVEHVAMISTADGRNFNILC